MPASKQGTATDTAYSKKHLDYLQSLVPESNRSIACFTVKVWPGFRS